MQDMGMGEGAALTAWGKWVESQPKGVISDAMRETGLAWSTVHKARFKLVMPDVAKLLSRFTGGAVKAADIARTVKRKRGKAKPKAVQS